MSVSISCRYPAAEPASAILKSLVARISIMKIAASISRYLLGILFLVFGMNGFLQFLPQPGSVRAHARLR